MRNVEVRQNIGLRLLEERTRLGLTQQEFADAIGGARLSIIHYESGRSSPSAETLAAMEEMGLDVRYVLTGMKQAPVAIDRERFKVAFSEAQRQCRKRGVTTEAKLDLVWRLYGDA